MSANLLNVLKEITAQYGDSVLSDTKRVSALLSDLARDEPKPQKYALIKCLEHGFARVLKNASESERAAWKQQLAQKLRDEEGLDLGLCDETLEMLAAVLFNEEQKPGKNLCKNCGKELREGWKACPFCLAPVESQTAGPVVSPKPGSGGKGVPAPARTQRKDLGEKVYKNGQLILSAGLINVKYMNALLCKDRLELKEMQGGAVTVIPIEKISSVEVFGLGALRIKMINKEKYEFSHGLKGRAYMESWRDAINGLRK